MNLFGGILTALGFRGVARDTGILPHDAGNSSKTTVPINEQTAMQIATVWSCVSLISRTVACMPMNVVRETSKGREIIQDHELNRVLKLAPNDSMTPFDFIEAMCVQLLLWGNSFALVNRSRTNVTSMIPLIPETVQVERPKNGSILYAHTTESARTVYPQERILHTRGLGHSGLIGLSPIAYHRETLGLEKASIEEQSMFFANGSRPSGFLVFDQFLKKEQRVQAKELFEGMVSGRDNVGKVGVLEGGVKFQATSIPSKDSELLASRQYTATQIAGIYLVPPHMIGIVDKSTSWGTGLEQQVLGFLNFTLKPYIKKLEQAMTRQLIKPSERKELRIRFDWSDLLSVDSQARANFLSTMVQNGLMTRNEGRGTLDMKPVTGGDELTVQVNLTSLEDLPRATSNAPDKEV